MPSRRGAGYDGGNSSIGNPEVHPVKVPVPDFASFKQQLMAGNLNVVLTRYSDIMLAVLVIGIIGIMIIPMPPFLLDLFLATNITIGVTLLMVSLYLPNALSLAAFPSILLITTLFRLALNVSSTRLILLYAYAGEVIDSFGQFVVAGDFIVGFVIFLIITLIQFLVVAKGAERVSEVSARFTLDALPGKQMSIDADLRAGLIDVEDARTRRDYLQRESQFYGAMDGAMKFVKGDAIAGIIISVINIAAGLTIGVAVKGMEFGAAAKKYTLLTIGDGLVSQIPSLIIATAAGIITTRVASAAGEEKSLGEEIGVQMLAQPKALGIAAGMLVGLALIPGLPFVPFMALAALSGGVAWGLTRTKEQKDREEIKAQVMESAQPESRPSGGKKKKDEGPRLPMAVPVILETSTTVTPLVDMSAQGARFIEELIPQMREWMFQDLGVHFPGVRVRGDAPYLDENTYMIYVNEVPAATGVVYPDRLFTSEGLDQLMLMGIQGKPGQHPDGQKRGMWVTWDEARNVPPAPGAVVQPDEYIAVHMAHVLRQNVDELLGIQDVQNILDLMEAQGYEALVRSVVPKLVSVQRLTDVLRRLLREDITIRNMRQILEALAEWGAFENDAVYLTEYVRMSLKQYIGFKFSGGRPVMSVHLLDPQIEQAVQEGIQQSASGSSLSLDPNVSQEILEGFRRGLSGRRDGSRPIILTQMEVRYFIKRLLEYEFPNVTVLSFQELPSELQIQPVGRIVLERSALQQGVEQ
ncbi:MAG TPA: type III secretion system export apparatus subunit SctV [Thermoanaerobaculia bacterium]|nr:type III secretion system export apparatus subunit SctV [Thermoanaerobaculia bacterium]